MSTHHTTKPSSLIEDFNKLMAKPDMLLADFVTPLSLEECIERLYGMRVAWLDTTVDLRVESLDADRQNFRLHLKQKRGRRIIDEAVVGMLQRQDAQMMQVTIAREYTSGTLTHWKRAMAVLAAILLVIFLVDKIVFVLWLIIVAMAMRENNHRAIATMIKQELSVPDAVSSDTP